MTFRDMTYDDIDLWGNLHCKYFDPHDCWKSGCNCVDERLLDDDYDEELFCDHELDDECPMFDVWKKMEFEKK